MLTSQTETFTPPTGTSGKSLGYTFADGEVGSSLSIVLSNVIGVITMVAGFAFFIYFLFATVNLITSAGDSNKIQQARAMMTYAIIGIVISAVAYPLVSLVSILLGIPLTEPSALFSQYLTFPGNPGN